MRNFAIIILFLATVFHPSRVHALIDPARAAAIEKAEASGKKAGSDEYRQAVIAALKATDMDCVTGHVTFNEYNNPEKTAAIINITGGAAKYWGNY